MIGGDATYAASASYDNAYVLVNEEAKETFISLDHLAINALNCYGILRVETALARKALGAL